VDRRPGGGDGGSDATASGIEVCGSLGAAPIWHSAAIGWFVSLVPEWLVECSGPGRKGGSALFPARLLMFKRPEALATEFVLSGWMKIPLVWFGSGGRDAGRLGAGVQRLAPKPMSTAVADLGLLDCWINSSKSVVFLTLGTPGGLSNSQLRKELARLVVLPN
jgi:hypothetical protein